MISCETLIRGMYPSFHEGERKIADYILDNPLLVINMTAHQLAKEVGAADSSIIRFSKRLGFEGFVELKINLAKNLKNPEMLLQEDIQSEDDEYTILRKAASSNIAAIEDTIALLNSDHFKKAVSLLENADEIVFMGLGSSAVIVNDAYYRFSRLGLNVKVSTDPVLMRITAGNLKENGVAFAISHSGRTIDTVRSLEIAKQKGAATISLSSFVGSPISDVSDVQLIAASKESKLMREAVASRIAQLTILDALYICIGLGRKDLYAESYEFYNELLNEIRYD